MRSICVVTGTRADYGLLHGSIELLSKDSSIDFRLVATGSHLSDHHGRSVEAIRKDGFRIDAEVDIGLTGSDPHSICHSMAQAIEGFSDYFKRRRPDLLLVLGDRFEILSVAQTAMIHNIPIAHIHGGEATEGLIDDAIRHSLTKMSHFHFTSTETYRKRVIQMGEKPTHVFNVGAPGLDNIRRLPLMNKAELENDLKIRFNRKNLLMTYHPVTLNREKTEQELKELFGALESLGPEVSVFLTAPNADTYSDLINDSIQRLLANRKATSHLFLNLGHLRYLSMMKNVDAVVGNSSSGIIEAPFLGKAVVNVGMRQKGRLTSKHVLHVDGRRDEILSKLQMALSEDFLKSLEGDRGLYGDGQSSEKIVSLVKDVTLKDVLYKGFHDLV